jgi:hypothetical protein
MHAALKRYLFVEQPIGAFVVNFVLNAPIAWAVCRGMTTVPLWGQTSVAGDTIATSFILPFLSVLIATPLVRRDVRHGKLPAESLTDSALTRRGLPRPLVARAVALGLGGLVVAAPLAVVALHLAGVTDVPMPGFIWAKAAYGAVLGALLAPTIAMAGVVDALSGERAPDRHAPRDRARSRISS